jgi:predicted membrane protein DUF2079
VPLYWVYPHTALLVLQSVALAAAVIPVYLVVWARLASPWMATALLAAFLLHPALQWGNVDEFHPESFLVLFASLALYAAITWKPRLLVVSVCSSLLVKEDVVLFVLPLAMWVALRRDRDLGRRGTRWSSSRVVSMASVYGLGALKSTRARIIGVVLVVLCSLWACLLWGIFPIADKTVSYRKAGEPRVRHIQALQAALPPDAVVSAHYSFTPHIAHRTGIYMWPNPRVTTPSTAVARRFAGATRRGGNSPVS